jgi:hypothetical protein
LWLRNQPSPESLPAAKYSLQGPSVGLPADFFIVRFLGVHAAPG